ncbi:MAG: hypothetical protein AB7O04_01475 [Hyphomonadaceae bacterium]
MTRITNAEQVLLLLRAQLENAQRKGRKDAARTSSAPQKSRSTLARVENVAKIDHLSDEQIARTLIGGLLEAEFGADVANTANFQTLIDSVHKLIKDHASARDLLAQAVQQLLNAKR